MFPFPFSGPFGVGPLGLGSLNFWASRFCGGFWPFW